MPNAEDMTPDAFLGLQGQPLYTVEADPADARMVRVAPSAATGACCCRLAVRVPRAAVVSVAPTGRRSACCGRTLEVVRLTFAEKATLSLEKVFEQLSGPAEPTAASDT